MKTPILTYIESQYGLLFPLFPSQKISQNTKTPEFWPRGRILSEYYNLFINLSSYSHKLCCSWEIAHNVLFQYFPVLTTKQCPRKKEKKKNFQTGKRILRVKRYSPNISWVFHLLNTSTACHPCMAFVHGLNSRGQSMWCHLHQARQRSYLVSYKTSSAPLLHQLAESIIETHKRMQYAIIMRLGKKNIHSISQYLELLQFL